MTLDEYQKLAGDTAIYPNRGNNLTYPSLGLSGEAGEIANIVKKVDRDDGGVLTEEKRQALIKELGDVLWYAAAIAEEIDTTLSEAARLNLEKLSSRKERGVLQGSGDNR